MPCGLAPTRAQRSGPWWPCLRPIPSSNMRCARPSAPARRSTCASCPGTLADGRGQIHRRRCDRGRHRSRHRPRAGDAGAATPDGAHRHTAAGGRGHAGASTRRSRAGCCRCGSPISWSSRHRRPSWCAPARGSRRAPPLSPRRPKPRSTRSCRPSAAPASPRWRSRPPCCCSTPARAAGRAPCWSTSISSMAPAPTISTLNRGSTSTRSSRGRSGSTASCSK